MQNVLAGFKPHHGFILWFPQFWLQVGFQVCMILRHDIYLNAAVLDALSRPGLQSDQYLCSRYEMTLRITPKSHDFNSDSMNTAQILNRRQAGEGAPQTP